MMRPAAVSVAAGCAVWLGGGGCAQFHPPSGEAAGRGAAAEPASACQLEAMLDDAEDGDNQILVHGGRGGYVYTFKDDHGSVVAPDGEFAMTAGGARGSRQSIRFHGKVADADSSYAGVGFSLTEPKSPYDAARFAGLSFYARRAPGSASSLRIKVPDANTDPDGQVCTECFNDFGIDFQVDEEWTQYRVSFADLKQGGGWGQPRPAAIDPSRLYSVQWQVSARGQSFDIWIDDVTFIGCP